MTAREELQTWLEHLSEQEAANWLTLVREDKNARKPFDFDQWYRAVSQAREAIAAKYGVVPSVADLVNEVNEERLDDLNIVFHNF